MKKLIALSCVAVCMFASVQQSQAAIADSIADFSGTQGGNGWTYLWKHFPDATWSQAQWDGPTSTWRCTVPGGYSSFIFLTATTQTFNEGNAYFTERQYTSTRNWGAVDVTFTYNFDGGLLKTMYNGTDLGTYITTYVDGSHNQLKTGSVTYHIANLGVGDTIASWMQNNGNGVGYTFPPQVAITITPEPATMILLGLGGLLLGRRK